MSKEWREDFAQFFADMGEPEPLMTIDRIDNNLDYSKENCRWATRSEQQKNRNCYRFITLNGITKTVMEWSDITGISHQTIYNRMDLGWDAESVLSPDKQINKEGLRLGGIANGERNKAKTHCPKGHEYTPENTRKSGAKGRSCKKCHAIREQRRRNAKKPI